MCAISDVGFDVPRDFVPDLVVLRAIDSVGDPATKEGANDNIRVDRVTCPVTGPRRRSTITEGGLEVPCSLSFEGPPELLKKFSKVVNAL